MQRPLLLVDIDGVLSLFGAHAHASTAALGTGRGARAAPAPGERGERAEPAVTGSFHAVDGIPHFLSSTAAAHLLELSPFFELVWASGWEEKANEHLPRLLGLPADLPFLRFPRSSRAGTSTRAHWKLRSIDAYAGARSLAWIDDAFDASCHEWARARSAPTLLVVTVPERGLTSREADLLRAWERSLEQG